MVLCLNCHREVHHKESQEKKAKKKRIRINTNPLLPYV